MKQDQRDKISGLMTAMVPLPRLRPGASLENVLGDNELLRELNRLTSQALMHICTGEDEEFDENIADMVAAKAGVV